MLVGKGAHRVLGPRLGPNSPSPLHPGTPSIKKIAHHPEATPCAQRGSCAMRLHYHSSTTALPGYQTEVRATHNLGSNHSVTASVPPFLFYQAGQWRGGPLHMTPCFTACLSDLFASWPSRYRSEAVARAPTASTEMQWTPACLNVMAFKISARTFNAQRPQLKRMGLPPRCGDA